MFNWNGIAEVMLETESHTLALRFNLNGNLIKSIPFKKFKPTFLLPFKYVYVSEDNPKL